MQAGMLRAEWKVLKRRLISIPSMEIKVGEFHTLERNSTPVFLNYVLTSVVSEHAGFS